MVREIRSWMVGSSETATDAPTDPRAYDPIEREWDLIEPALVSAWPELAGSADAPPPSCRQRAEARLCDQRGYTPELASGLIEDCFERYEHFHGLWGALKDSVVEHWPALEPTDVATMEGRLSELVGLVARRQELDWAQARRQVAQFLRECGYAERLHQSLRGGPAQSATDCDVATTAMAS